MLSVDISLFITFLVTIHLYKHNNGVDFYYFNYDYSWDNSLKSGALFWAIITLVGFFSHYGTHVNRKLFWTGGEWKYLTLCCRERKTFLVVTHLLDGEQGNVTSCKYLWDHKTRRKRINWYLILNSLLSSS